MNILQTIKQKIEERQERRRNRQLAKSVERKYLPYVKKTLSSESVDNPSTKERLKTLTDQLGVILFQLEKEIESLKEDKYESKHFEFIGLPENDNDKPQLPSNSKWSLDDITKHFTLISLVHDPVFVQLLQKEQFTNEQIQNILNCRNEQDIPRMLAEYKQQNEKPKKKKRSKK